MSNINYISEDEYLNKVEGVLRRNGCETWREVIPDQCKDWNMPYRVDLIFYRDDIGYVGVEGKNINTLRKGSVLSKAITQIKDKYENKTYFNGNIISRWCIAVPLKTLSNDEKSHNEILLFIKNFIKYKYNISILELNDKYKDNSISIDSYTKSSLYFRGN
jgi:hypothetical protein